MSDMRHMNYLEEVASNDVDVLRHKELTYQGSWKAAGGRSAWFMARRNMDRLLTMMRPPPVTTDFSLADLNDLVGTVDQDNPDRTLAQSVLAYLRDAHVAEDIFLKIEEHPGGEDGTVLAVMRDLRRYLLLVEAEMTARGTFYVKLDPIPPSATASQLARAAQGETLYTRVNVSGDAPIREISPKVQEPYVADGMIHEDGTSRWLVGDRDARALRVGDACTFAEPGAATADVTVRELHKNNTALVEYQRNGMRKYALGGQLRYHDLSAARFDAPSDNAPWIVSPGYALRKSIDQELFDKFWSVRAPGVLVLEPHVVSHNVPRSLRDFYDCRGENWTLRIGRCPSGPRDMFPRLSRELNMMEHHALPEWQRVLYAWHDDTTKFALNEQSVAWAGEDES